MAVAGPVWAVRTVTVPCSRQGPYRDTPTRSGGSKPQATVDRSEPRHSSQLHCGSDHDLGRHVGDHHGQTTTWGRYTPILTVALRPRASCNATNWEGMPPMHLVEPQQTRNM